jgi:hypothetical protein
VERHLAKKSSVTLSFLPVFGCAFTGLIISEYSCFLPYIYS